MSSYLSHLVLVIMLGATFGYLFAPQIDQAKDAFTRWTAQRKRQRRR